MSRPPLPTDEPAPRASGGFDADWLRNREPWDALARDRQASGWGLPALQAWTAARLAQREARGGVLQVLDLGSGTGANLRYLAPRLGGDQRWCLVDHDAALLAAQPGCLAAWANSQGLAWQSQADPGQGATPHGTGARAVGLLTGVGWRAEVYQRRLDLARLGDDPAGEIDVAGVDLLTASALLDLLSATAVERLIALGLRCRTAMLWALNVDGRRIWQPADADDPLVAALFTCHQQRDKGFGPALGPAAGDCAAARLRDDGWRVNVARSDWELDASTGAAARSLLAALVEGDAGAALEQAAAEDAQARIRAWALRRLSSLGGAPCADSPAAGSVPTCSAEPVPPAGPHLQACIGHVEVLALPPDPSRPDR
jgi:SAM-dependent methyltransferase